MALWGKYFKQNKEILLKPLSQIFNAVTSSSSFPNDMLNAFIVTLPKPGKEPTSPQNFRPISLLYQDPKLYAKVIANCLIDILPELVCPDQLCFTKGQQISDATRHMINIIHYAQKL